MYADDAILFLKSQNLKNLNEAINNDLWDLNIWLRDFKLSLNLAKTRGKLICTKDKHKALEGTR